MFRIVIVILIYYSHKPIDLINIAINTLKSLKRSSYYIYHMVQRLKTRLLSTEYIY
jgi:hypothetical protein